MTATPDYTSDELLVSCIARVIPDGAVVAQGIATPLVAAAYFLAGRTHAPRSLFSFTVGNSFGVRTGRLSLTRFEELTLGRSLHRWSFARCVAEYLPRLRPWVEFFRPAQVDPYGNFNNVRMGAAASPTLQLPGCGGIADVSPYLDEFYLYVPRHDARVLVPQVDFISGVGYRPGEDAAARRARGVTGGGPRQMVTDLGIFEFGPEGPMRAVSLHPGVTPEQVRAATGFPVHIPENTPVTPPPSAEELRLLREEIDPLGIRRLELLGGQARNEAIRRILREEEAQFD